MEEKELNLYELLKDCAGEEFYSLTNGKIRFIKTLENNLLVFQGFSRVVFNQYGYLFSLHDGSAKCLLYPSLNLYEKYPLNPKKAWEEWSYERRRNIIRIDFVSEHIDEEGDRISSRIID